MKNTTVTVDLTRLMKKAKKAIKAVKDFDKACKKFGTDPQDVVVSDLEVLGKRGDENIGNDPIEIRIKMDCSLSPKHTPIFSMTNDSLVQEMYGGEGREWEKALVKTVTDEGVCETISFHKWYPVTWEMIPSAAKESLVSYDGTVVVGGFGFRKKPPVTKKCPHDWKFKTLGKYFSYFKCDICGKKSTTK
jgi:hypothetical protein